MRNILGFSTFAPCQAVIFSACLRGLRLSVMVFGMFSWHTLGPLVPIGHCINATAYPTHVHPFMVTMYPSSDGYFQHHVTKLESFQIGFLNMKMS